MKIKSALAAARQIGIKLSKLLEERRLASSPPELEVTNLMVKKVAQQNVVENSLNVGHKLPDLELTTAKGETLNLKSLIKEGPLVIKFFRGSWCRFCSADLDSLEECYEIFKGLGANVVAICPMPAEATKVYADKKFHVVGGEVGREVIAKFNLGYNLIPEYRIGVKYGLGADLQEIYQQEEVNFPLSATYVFNYDGSAVYSYLNEDARYRADLGEVAGAIIRTQRNSEAYLLKVKEAETSASGKVNARRSSSDVKSLESISPLEFCLTFEPYKESFCQFLEKTICIENFFFYTEVTSYRENYNSSSSLPIAQKIFEVFIATGSLLEVNIDDSTRAEIISDVENKKFSLTMFDAAAKEIYNLMESDSYPKWTRTKEYSATWLKHGKIPRFAPPSALLVDA